MKTLCYLADQYDERWIAEYIKEKSNIENIVVFAPSFEGRLVAESIKFPYKTYEEEAWKIKKTELADVARIKSHEWFQLPEIRNNNYLKTVRNFKDYPLLEMHQSYFLLDLFEILQSYEFMGKVLELENPEKIVIGKRNNPFDISGRLQILTQEDGLEREALKVLSKKHKLIVEEKETNFLTPTVPKFTFNKGETKPFIKDFDKIVASIWKLNKIGPKILIFAWAGYYLEYLKDSLEKLLNSGSRICLVIVGDYLKPEELNYYQSKGILTFYKSEWELKDEIKIFNEWKNIGLKAFQFISQNDIYKKYFSNRFGSYFQGLVDKAIKKQLVENIPLTVIELLRTESITKSFKPEIVVAHFAYHAWESCDALPARLQGIPTLTLEHGVTGYIGSARDTFATQYYAVNGDVYKDALVQSTNCSPEMIIPVGNPRLDKINCETNIKKVKEAFGFNSKKPLCIFCDKSGWSQSPEYRHITFKMVQQILDLKKHIPDLQIIYRVHHGGPYRFMKMFFDRLGIEDIKFQISPTPAFSEIVQAADVVISHYTTAIDEALLSGVRVIYLCDLAEPEPSYFDCEAIKIAHDCKRLHDLVEEIIKNPKSRKEVRSIAQTYFERKLHGADGQAGERLALLILKLAKTPKNRRKIGFQDWLDRIEASCHFKSESWKKMLTSNKENINFKYGRNAINKQNNDIVPNDYRGHNLVFIVGSPRSGTTWLQKLLISHPKVRSGQETDLFDMFIGKQLQAWRYLKNYKLSGRPVGLPCYFREREYLSILKKYMLELLKPMIGSLRSDELFIEKTPSHALYIDEIIEMLPESRFIHVLRDPRDVVASLLAASKSWGKNWAPNDAGSATRMWKNHIRSVQRSSKKLSKDQFFEMRYEDLSSKPKVILNMLISFLGLEWSDVEITKTLTSNQLQTAKKTGGTTIPIAGEIAKLLKCNITIEPNGFMRKGRVGSWKEELSEEDLKVVHQVAGRIMKNIGYNQDSAISTANGKYYELGLSNVDFPKKNKDAISDSANGPKAVYERLRHLIESGDIAIADSEAKKAILKYPESLKLRKIQADIKICENNLHESKRILLMIIKQSPTYVDALNNLALIEYKEGNWQSAREFIKDALIIDPLNKTASSILFQVQEKLNSN
jgi:hypothetical protein